MKVKCPNRKCTRRPRNSINLYGGGRRKNTPYKPYWCDELSRLWKLAHEKEIIYTKFKGARRAEEQLRQQFKQARNNFDKLLKRRQREYRRGFLIIAERLNTSDPREFWKHIQKLGPRTKNPIPWEVYDSSGNINTDREFILNHWKSEYSQLYNDGSGSYDDVFKADIMTTKEHKERSMQDPLYNTNVFLNRPIRLDEVKKVVKNTKNGKAIGTEVCISSRRPACFISVML